MTLLLPGSLPYLFSPHGCAGIAENGLLVNRVARFLDAFEASPGRGALRFPEVGGGTADYEVSPRFLDGQGGPALARSAKVLTQSVHALLRERGIEADMPLPTRGSAWRLFNFTSLGEWQGEVGGVALEGSLGRTVEIGREHPCKPWWIEVGWRSPSSMVSQSVEVYPDSTVPPRVSYCIEYVDLGVASLRRFLGLPDDPIENILRLIARDLARSGIYPQTEYEDHKIHRNWHDGLDMWTLDFSGDVDIELSASSFEKDDRTQGPERVEEIRLDLQVPRENAFRPLGPHLEPLWNFGEALAFHRGDPFGPTRLEG